VVKIGKQLNGTPHCKCNNYKKPSKQRHTTTNWTINSEMSINGSGIWCFTSF